MKDKDWELLYELYKIPNITKVAGKLYMTQPTLTKRLQVIEAEFGIQIVKRSTKGVEFTPEGEFLAKRAEKYMAFMEDLWNELKAYREENGKTIVLGASYTFSKYRLPEILRNFFSVNPEVKFEIVNEQSDVLYQRLLEGTVDMAFIRNDFDGPPARFLIEKSPGYVISKEPLSLEELKDRPYIEYRTNVKTREMIHHWWYQYHDTERVKGMNAGYVDFVWEFVNRDLGYTVCFAQDLVNHEQHLSKLPIYHKDGRPVTRNTWFTYMKLQRQSPVPEQFIRFVRENYRCEDV